MEGIAMALTTIGITNLRPKKADYRVAESYRRKLVTAGIGKAAYRGGA
jgi:hypothetical protein